MEDTIKKPITVVNDEGKKDPETKSGYSSYLKEKDPTGHYEFVLEPIPANRNPLYVATGHPDVVKKLKMWSKENKTCERLNGGSMAIFHTTRPFVLITCKKVRAVYAIGAPVRKLFQNKPFDGIITSFDAKNHYYQVTYSDGDQEECTEAELKSILLPSADQPPVP